MIAVVGLFVAFFVLMYILCKPDDYNISLFSSIAERIKNKVYLYFTSGEKQKIYDVLNKEPDEVIKTGFMVSGGLALLALFFAYGSYGLFAMPIAVLVFLAGLYIVNLVFYNEYRNWQAGLFEGIPTLVNFMPSFLETGAITPREAMSLSIPFLPEPLRSEMRMVVERITRTGNVHDALNEFSYRADHPVVDAVCFRIGASWDTKVTPDIFADLNDQIQDMAEIAATKASAAKSGTMALVCVIGLLGAGLVFGYPGMMYLFSTMGGIF